MTKKEAKTLCLEVWQYLADHPEVRSKRLLPPELYSKLKDITCLCPLCELFYNHYCEGCPLESCSFESLYYNWLSGSMSAAQNIIDTLKAWEICED